MVVSDRLYTDATESGGLIDPNACTPQPHHQQRNPDPRLDLDPALPLSWGAFFCSRHSELLCLVQHTDFSRRLSHHDPPGALNNAGDAYFEPRRRVDPEAPVTDPSLIAACVTVSGTIAGVITTWLRIRGRVQLRHTQADARKEVVRALIPGSRFVETDQQVIIEVGQKAPTPSRDDR
ncbi:hypothetical protein [Actinomadura napierensis]|uniref:BON domain-containing protein n=1 Tax=Actinomadura napierensis TaxID=267854 RepID=A0ABN3AI77_9ACTN